MHDQDVPPVPRRVLVAVALGWTLACGAWLGSAAMEGKLDTGPVTLAVAGMVGVIWFIGLLIVFLFWVGSERGPGSDDREGD